MFSILVFMFQTCCHKCLCTSQPDQLHCGGPDSTAPSVNKDPVTSLHPRNCVEQLVSGEPDLENNLHNIEVSGK